MTKPKSKLEKAKEFLLSEMEKEYYDMKWARRLINKIIRLAREEGKQK